MKKLLNTLVLFSSLLFTLLAQAGYGIDCYRPVFANTNLLSGTGTTFTMNCKNNTAATFSGFTLTIEELDDLDPAMLTFDISWPHGINNIRPGDTGIVTGTAYFPESGDYEFDFSKAYGGEVYEGIFCQNGKDSDDCITVAALCNPNRNEFLYITTLGDSPYAISVCSVDVNGTGELSNCQNSGFPTPNTRPGQIVFSTIGNTNYAYATTYVDSVYRCLADPSTGLLSDCTAIVNIPDTNIIGIQFFSTTSGKLYAFLGDGNENGKIWRCPVNTANGAFGTCVTASPQEYYEGALFLTIQSFNGVPYLYVPNGNDGNTGEFIDRVFKCPIDPATAAIPASCPDSGAGAIFAGPDSIAFSNNNTIAYVAAYTEANVTLCDVDLNGNLSNCALIPPDFSSPNQIQTPTINGVNYFYMADTGTGYVDQCIVGSDGSLSNCNAAETGFDFPFGITFWP